MEDISVLYVEFPWLEDLVEEQSQRQTIGNSIAPSAPLTLLEVWHYPEGAAWYPNGPSGGEVRYDAFLFVFEKHSSEEGMGNPNISWYDELWAFREDWTLERRIAGGGRARNGLGEEEKTKYSFGGVTGTEYMVPLAELKRFVNRAARGHFDIINDPVSIMISNVKNVNVQNWIETHSE